MIRPTLTELERRDIVHCLKAELVVLDRYIASHEARGPTAREGFYLRLKMTHMRRRERITALIGKLSNDAT